MPIAVLPGEIADVSSAIARGGYLVTRRSAFNWLRTGDTPNAAYLANVRVNLKIFFATRTSSTILFFFHHDGETYIPIEAAIQFRIRPVSEPPAPVPAAIPRSSVLPSFVMTGLSQTEIASFGPTGATLQNTVFLALGDGSNILAVTNANDRKRAAMRYSPNRIPGPEQNARTGYPVQAFLDLMQTLRAWLDDDTPAGTTLPAIGSSQPNALRQILDALTAAYVDTGAQLAIPGDPLAEAPDWFRKYYRLDNFAASLRLRVKRDGSIAEKPSQERMAIAANLTIGGASPASTLTVGDPGFAVTGSLRSAYLDELSFDPACTRQLAKMLDVFDIQVRYYMESARRGAIVLRIRESDNADRAIIWLPGAVAGRPMPLLLSGLFLVKEGPTPSVVVDEDVDIVSLAGALDREEAAPFFTLVSTIQLWIGLL